MTSSKACDILFFQALFQACVNVISCKLHGRSEIARGSHRVVVLNVAVSARVLPVLDLTANLTFLV